VKVLKYSCLVASLYSRSSLTSTIFCGLLGVFMLCAGLLLRLSCCFCWFF
jgi:hypothetical protein